MSAAAKAPAKKSVYERAGGFVIFILFWGGLIAYHALGQTVWSMIMIEPKLAPAKAFVQADQPEKALPIVTGLLREHPTDAGLLYFAAGLYLELDRPLLAHFYLTALLKNSSPSDLSAEQRSRVVPLQMEETILSFRDSQFQTDQREQLDRLFYRLPKGWQIITYLHDANAVLNQPADQNVDSVGYTPPETPVSCDGGKSACGFRFSSGNLWRAIAGQKLTINDPRGGKDCCSLSLDDTDLRSLDLAYLDFLKAREAAGEPVSDGTQEGDNAILAYRSHVLIKQYYVLGFIKDASDTLPESNLDYYLAAGWAVFLIALYTAIGMMLESRRKPR